jgi:hypothetical protein
MKYSVDKLKDGFSKMSTLITSRFKELNDNQEKNIDKNFAEMK